MDKYLILLFLFFSTPAIIYSQELNCIVVINARQIETTERTIFKEMEVAFMQFINNRKWSDDKFEKEEKINCNIVITLESQPSIGNYEATAQLISARPIYGTSYETVLFNFADRDWSFEYNQSQPLDYNDNTFISNITSLLAYYSYMILGYDYDTFENLGGDKYYNLAQKVVNNAQQTGFKGWDQFNSIRNRYWLVENTLNPQIKPFRSAIYEYHRNGLDLLIDKPKESRKIIEKAIKNIQDVNKVQPGVIYTISFLDTKYNEIINIFSDGDFAIRKNIYNIMKELNPGRSSEYEKIIKN